MTIIEKLNYLDNKGIDQNNYKDLRNMYEAVQDRLTPQEKTELKKLITTTDDPDMIAAFLATKEAKENESLVESGKEDIFDRIAAKYAR